LIADKGTVICGRCGTSKASLSKKARVPKKDAGSKAWVDFANMFLHGADKENLLLTIGKIKEKEKKADKSESPVLKYKLKHELVEFLISYTCTYLRIDIREVLRNGRGFNKWTNKELVKYFEKHYKELCNMQVDDADDWRGRDTRNTRDSLMERGDLIQTLIIEKEFGL
jgi:hypothetical protein